MATRTLPAPLHIPNTSYGPFRLLEPVPWLMLAATCRLMVVLGGFRAFLALIACAFALFIAFLLAARRTIEWSGGQTGLDELTFAEQWRLSRRVLGRLLLVMVIAWLAVALLLSPMHGPPMLLGFVGIAFMPRDVFMMAWCAVIAALALLMIVRVGAGETLSLKAALRELMARWRILVPAIAILTLAYVVLGAFQLLVHKPLQAFWLASQQPPLVKSLIHLAYLTAFAALRLWCTLAILTLALRESYRRDEGGGVAASESS